MCEWEDLLSTSKTEYAKKEGSVFCKQRVFLALASASLEESSECVFLNIRVFYSLIEGWVKVCVCVYACVCVCGKSIGELRS